MSADDGERRRGRRTEDSGFLEERGAAGAADVANLDDVVEEPDVEAQEGQDIPAGPADIPLPVEEDDQDLNPDPDQPIGMALNANQLNFLRDFSGAPEDDVEVQVVSVNRARDLFGWTPEQTAHMASAKLKGEAARWLRAALKTQDDTIENLEKWEASAGEPQAADHVLNVLANPLKKFLKDKLLERFRESVNQLGAVDAVMDLRQKPGEEVSAFFDRVSLAVDRKNHHEADRTTAAYRLRLKREIFAFFAAGLHDDLRIQALGGPIPPDDTDALLVACKNAELERKRMKKPKDISAIGSSMEEATTSASAPASTNAQAAGETAGSTNGAGIAPGPLDLAALAEQIDALRQEVQKQNFTCFRCGEKGHFIKECPHAPPAGFRPTQFRPVFRGRGRPFRARGRGGFGGFRPRSGVRGRRPQRMFAFEENPETGEFVFQEIHDEEETTEQDQIDWEWHADDTY